MGTVELPSAAGGISSRRTRGDTLLSSLITVVSINSTVWSSGIGQTDRRTNGPITALMPMRTVYSQAQGCVCTALQLGGDAEQPWLTGKYDVIRKTGST